MSRTAETVNKGDEMPEEQEFTNQTNYLLIALFTVKGYLEKGCRVWQLKGSDDLYKYFIYGAIGKEPPGESIMFELTIDDVPGWVNYHCGMNPSFAPLVKPSAAP